MPAGKTVGIPQVVACGMTRWKNLSFRVERGIPMALAGKRGRDLSGCRLRNDRRRGCSLHDKCHLFSLGEEPLSCLQRLIYGKLL